MHYFCIKLFFKFWAGITRPHLPQVYTVGLRRLDSMTQHFRQLPSFYSELCILPRYARKFRGPRLGGVGMRSGLRSREIGLYTDGKTFSRLNPNSLTHSLTVTRGSVAQHASVSLSLTDCSACLVLQVKSAHGCRNQQRCKLKFHCLWCTC